MSLFSKPSVQKIFLFFCLAWHGPSYCEETKTNDRKLYSIEECIFLAQQNNQTLAAAEAKIEGAVAEKNQARSAFLPHISLEGAWANNNRSLSGDLTQFQDFNSSTSLGITTKLGLWDFGASLNRLRAGRMRIDVSKVQKEYALLLVEEEVRTSYLKILEKEKFIEVIASSLQTLQQQLTTSQRLHEQGIAKSTDVLTVKVQLAEEEKHLLHAKNSVLQERMTLNKLIGLPITEQISLNDISAPPATFSFDKIEEYALEHRADLIALRKQLEALRLDRTSAKQSIAPQLYAFANGNYSYAHKHQVAGSAGLGLKMDLYQGGQREAKIDKIDSQIQECNALLIDLCQNVQLELNNTFLRFDEIQKSFSIDQQAISLAEENLNHTMNLYKQGIVSINDVLLSEEQLYKVRMNYFSNLYKSHITCVRLITLSGGFSIP